MSLKMGHMKFGQNVFFDILDEFKNGSHQIKNSEGPIFEEKEKILVHVHHRGHIFKSGQAKGLVLYKNCEIA